MQLVPAACRALDILHICIAAHSATVPLMTASARPM
jgi:hypothetical protein